MVVPELGHTRMPIERGLYNPALDTSSAAVHEPDLVNAGRRRRVDVLRDDRRNIPRRERVEIDVAFDRDFESHFCLLPFAFFLS